MFRAVNYGTWFGFLSLSLHLRCGAEEDEFWEGIQAVKFLGVPELQQQITVTGYPIGGDSLSITQGIVSRVTMSPYTSGAAQLINIQVRFSFSATDPQALPSCC